MKMKVLSAAQLLLIYSTLSTIALAQVGNSQVTFGEAQKKCAERGSQLPNIAGATDFHIKNTASEGKAIWLQNQRYCSVVRWQDGTIAEEGKKCHQDCVALDIRDCKWTCAECRAGRDGFACQVPGYDCSSFTSNQLGRCVNRKNKAPIVVMASTSNFYESKRLCKSYGGELAHLEKDRLSLFCQDLIGMQERVVHLWLGAIRCTWGKNEEEWSWHFGHPVANNHRCVILRRKGLQLGLESVSCSEKHYFVCRKGQSLFSPTKLHGSKVLDASEEKFTLRTAISESQSSGATVKDNCQPAFASTNTKFLQISLPLVIVACFVCFLVGVCLTLKKTDFIRDIANCGRRHGNRNSSDSHPNTSQENEVLLVGKGEIRHHRVRHNTWPEWESKPAWETEELVT